MQYDNQVLAQNQTPPEEVQPTEDKAVEQSNMAEVQVDSNTPEATQGEGEKSQEIKAEDKVEDSLILGKFKSQEDLEKAYANLESQRTKDAQEKAELARILNESFVAPEPVQAPVAEADPYNDYPEPDPVAQKLEVLERKSVVQDFIFTHTDADAQGMQEVLTKDPIAAAIPDHNARLEYAYHKSKNMASPKAVVEAQKQATTQAQLDAAKKQAAQVEAVQKQSMPVNDKNELSQDQLQSALRDDKAFDNLIKERFPGVSKMRSQV